MHLEGQTAYLGPDVSYETTPALWAQLKRSQFKTLDLSRLSKFDSSVIALLIECQKEAAKQGAKLQILHVPSSLLSLAKVCGVEKLLS